MEIIPLGTASALPTRDRHLSGLVLLRAGRAYLFDCGEGTQMQMLHAGVKLMRLEGVYISHFHGDHFYGLFGLLSTLSLLKRSEPLTVAGPKGIADVVHTIPGLEPEWLTFRVDWKELDQHDQHVVVYETGELRVTARPLDHRDYSAGFRFEEKPRAGRLDVDRARSLGVENPHHFRLLKQGKSVRARERTVHPDEVVGPPHPGRSFAYVSDTRPTPNAALLAREVDLLYHEATFGEELAERAFETGHATAASAARIAREAGAKRLLIGHFSARYRDVDALVEEARAVFGDTEAAEELKTYAIG